MRKKTSKNYKKEIPKATHAEMTIIQDCKGTKITIGSEEIEAIKNTTKDKNQHVMEYLRTNTRYMGSKNGKDGTIILKKVTITEQRI